MLSSWKEIAHFFGKGVRTVQRWEKTLNLPIRRPPGAPSNVVLARTSDLEAWMHRGLGKSAMDEASSEAESKIVGTDGLVTELEQAVRSLIVHAGGKVKAAQDEATPATSAEDRLQRLLEDVKSSGVEVEQEHQLRKVA